MEQWMVGMVLGGIVLATVSEVAMLMVIKSNDFGALFIIPLVGGVAMVFYAIGYSQSLDSGLVYNIGNNSRQAIVVSMDEEFCVVLDGKKNVSCAGADKVFNFNKSYFGSKPVAPKPGDTLMLLRVEAYGKKGVVILSR